MHTLGTVGRGEMEDLSLVAVDNEGWWQLTMKVEILLQCTVEQHKGFIIMNGGRLVALVGDETNECGDDHGIRGG